MFSFFIKTILLTLPEKLMLTSQVKWIQSISTLLWRNNTPLGASLNFLSMSSCRISLLHQNATFLLLRLSFVTLYSLLCRYACIWRHKCRSTDWVKSITLMWRYPHYNLEADLNSYYDVITRLEFKLFFLEFY